MEPVSSKYSSTVSMASTGNRYVPLPNRKFGYGWRPRSLRLPALMGGEPGLGKSKNLQYLAHNLERLENVVVGVMERPQSSLADFYREMGDLFGVNLTPSNRYGGFKALRERWRQYIKSTLFRPILLIDKAQEMMTSNLNELRLLGSAQFDSECLLTVILCGDLTLPERFRSNELLALGSRIRFRRMLSPYDKKELRTYLEYCLAQAGAPQLMTKPSLTNNSFWSSIHQHHRKNNHVKTQKLFLLLQDKEVW